MFTRSRTHIKDTHAFVDIQLEFLLRDAFLDPLAEGGVPGGSAAALPVLDQAAALAVKRGSRRAVVAVLLGTEPIHRFLSFLNLESFTSLESQTPRIYLKCALRESLKATILF